MTEAENSSSIAACKVFRSMFWSAHRYRQWKFFDAIRRGSWEFMAYGEGDEFTFESVNLKVPITALYEAVVLTQVSQQ